MKIHEVLTAIEKLEGESDSPSHKAMCALFPTRGSIAFSSNQVSFQPEGDYVSIEDAREAAEWLVDQLGGKVKWSKK